MREPVEHRSGEPFAAKHLRPVLMQVAALRAEVLDLAFLAALKHAAGLHAEPLLPLRDLHGMDVEVLGDLLHCLDPFEGR